MTANTYSDRYIAFLDVLGFGALIDCSGADLRQRSEIIRRVSEAISWSVEEAEELVSFRAGIVFTQFSDSLVVSVDARDIQFNMAKFCLAILSTIRCFLGSGLLIRGGVTRGLLVHNNELLFGPAMNRAYHLESKQARVPRVILDENVPELAIELDRSWPLPLREDEDGFSYIDYFQPQGLFFLAPAQWLAIRNAIKAMPNTPAISEKRAWMIDKYNGAIAHFSYSHFKKQLGEYVDRTENTAVIEDQLLFLKSARKVRPLPIL